MNFNAILAYLSQSSTWAGLVSIAAALGYNFPTSIQDLITKVPTLVVGLFLIFWNQHGVNATSVSQAVTEVISETPAIVADVSNAIVNK